MMDESRLIQRTAQGEPAAWEPIMLAHQEPVFRFAYLLLGDPDEAEDITQETFLRAYYHLGHFDITRPLRPWLLSITANLSRNRRRSASRYLNAISRAFHIETRTSPNIEERSELEQDSRQLWKAVRRLSTDDQQVIYLRFFLDLTVAEVAQALDVAEGTVKSRLNRALERLRAIIKSDFPMLSEGYEV
jgi:RNA polymerase sigma-70 factor (ECF subfamily)